MSWSFVVETGEQVAGANSYASVTDATDYFTPDINFSAIWNALTATQQQHRLAWATRILDQKTYWRGTRTANTQALRWPRSGVYSKDGELVDDDEIPIEIVAATCELAKYLNTSTNDLTVGPDATNLKRVKADVVELEYQDGVQQSTVPSIINAIISGLGVFRAGGSSFARISKTG